MVMFGVPPRMVEALRRVRRRLCGTGLWTCCVGRAGTRIRSEAPHRMLTIGRLAADQAGARPYIAPRRLQVQVGTRSRLIRGSTSDGHVWCTASDGRGTPARPGWPPVWNAPVDVLRRTRRNAYTIRGAAPDVNHRTSCRASRGSASLQAGANREHRRDDYALRGRRRQDPQRI